MYSHVGSYICEITPTEAIIFGVIAHFDFFF